MGIVRRFAWLFVLSMLVGTCIPLLGQEPLDNHFTYQGQIKQNGAPFNGSCNFIFSLYPDSITGSMIGAAFNAPGITVTRGLFTVQLEFAANAFNGDKRWLEIQAQCPVGSGELTTLSPRQELTAAPYAAYAMNADLLDGQHVAGLQQRVTGTCSSGSSIRVINTDGTVTCQADNVGIGDITAVNTAAGSGLTGGVVSGDANLTIADLGVTTQRIADNAVTTLKVADNAVTSPKLVDSAITTLKLANGSVTTAKLSAAGSSTNNVLASNGSSVVWADPQSFILPFYESLSYANPAFWVANSSSGSSTHSAIAGYANAGAGLMGQSLLDVGVYGWTYGVADGVRGESGGNNVSGVYGVNSNANGFGVYGRNTPRSTTGYLGGEYGAWGSRDTYSGYLGFSDGGVLGSSTSGNYGYLGMSTRAGYFSGNVDISGNLTKTSGSFKIDHPLDPANMYLYHSFVESPDMKNIYDGVVALDDEGEAVVQLPAYFDALNADVRYQLTCIGGYAPVYIAQEVENNEFRIAGGWAGLRVSWQVTGIRQDAYAKAHPITPEVEKPLEERGLYLHPAEHGVSPTLRVDQKILEKVLTKDASPKAGSLSGEGKQAPLRAPLQ
jgi:hypothetical protein